MNRQTRPDLSFRQSSFHSATGRRQKTVPQAKKLAPPTILVLATPSAPLDGLLTALEFRDYRVLVTARAEEALPHLARQALDLLLVELDAGWQERLAVIQAAQNCLPPPPVILLGYQETPLPPVAFRLEVADYLLFPDSGSAALRRVDRVLGRPHRRDRVETEAHLTSLNLKALLRIKEMVAACTELLEALGRAMDLAEPPAPVITTAASEQEFPANHSGPAPSGIIDLEILA
ncbi:MAG: hypothetical protein WHT07_01370 [Desulfobaccales bacterium]